MGWDELGLGYKFPASSACHPADVGSVGDD